MWQIGNQVILGFLAGCCENEKLIYYPVQLEELVCVVYDMMLVDV